MEVFLLLRLFMRLLLWPFYRLRVVRPEHVPATGGALLVGNHVSFLDGLFVNAAVRRRVRFIVAESYYRHPLLKPFMKWLGCIPIRSTGGPRSILRSLQQAGEALDRGEVVCIFAEGEITRTGSLLPFRRGIERIARDRKTPIIPLQIDGAWGSIFSYAGGRVLGHLPRRLPRPVTILFGAPLPAETPIAQIRDAVAGLGTEAWLLRQHGMQPLDYSVLKGCRRHRFRLAMADPVRGEISWLKALTGTIALARVLRGVWGDQRAVGFLLPPSIGGALANLAAMLTSRVVCNLNYTTGKAGMEIACRQAGLKTVLTSSQFLQKANLQAPEGVEVVMLDDIAKRVTSGGRIFALLLALFAPLWLVRSLTGALRRPTVDDTAFLIFSSGSTGEPKGVELSHANVLSNVEGACQVLDFGPHDRVLHMLPFFHAFGNLLLWAGVHLGASLVFLPNPLDAEAVGDMAEGYSATILVGTPTFLQLYMKRCQPGQFGSLRMVVAGAEKLPQAFARAFEAHFGIAILEGYGCTECSPVVAVNTPDFRGPGIFQKGNRPGSVGRPFPVVSVRVIHPDTGEPLPMGEAGMLLVRGPNVMKGYLGRADLTARVIADGWYTTGDIARLDEDGFITITDRLSRFSKIGGEMVPHGKVEDALHAVLEATEQVFAVTAVPDDAKGERLVVVHCHREAAVEVWVKELQARGLPNLFIPKPRDFVCVEALPVLGSGKLDLRALKQLALQSVAR
ncbi:MAG: AMP-binding protein [Planctomycetes bacterium]|nr:AMP-binding protein [Planctomycetota bacterium]